MEKLIFLLLGVLLKQIVDELKSLAAEYVNYLKELRAATMEYRPNPPLQAGSQEALSAINRANYAQMMAPEARRLTRKILLVRFGPLTVYLLAAGGLLVLLRCLDGV